MKNKAVPYIMFIMSFLFMTLSLFLYRVMYNNLEKEPQVIVKYVGYTNTVIETQYDIKHKYIGYTNTVIKEHFNDRVLTGTNCIVVAPTFNNNGVSTLIVTNLLGECEHNWIRGSCGTVQ